jgi:Leucine-rich repeat (LRR) protein
MISYKSMRFKKRTKRVKKRTKRVKKRTKRVKKRTKRVKKRTKGVKKRTKRVKGRTKRVKGRTRGGQTGGMEQSPPPIAGSPPIEGEQNPVDQVFINEDLIRKISGMGGDGNLRFKWGQARSPTSASLSQTNRFLRDTLHQDDITEIQKRDFVAEITDSLPKGGVLGELKKNPNLITYYVAGAYIAGPSGLGKSPHASSWARLAAGGADEGVSLEEYNSWTSVPAVYLKSHQKYLLEKFNNLGGLTLTEQHKDTEIRFNIDFFKYIKLPILQVLTLNDNGIQDLTPLQGLTTLRSLDLSDNQITDVGPLQGLTRLTHLYLDGNQITDVGSLQGLTALTHLYLDGNQITDVGPLQKLTALTTVDLNGNQITDVGPLQKLTRLTYLALNGNQITDVGPLQKPTRLTILDLGNNQITDVGPLQGLTRLTELDLSENQITDVGPLQGLTALTHLDLDGNQITDVGPLQGLTSLTYLALKNNHIADATPLFSSDMAPDLSLRLSGNHLDLQDLQSHGHFIIS